MTNTATETKARCYAEFCCNEATHAVEVLNLSGNPASEPIPWGFCSQHYGTPHTLAFYPCEAHAH
jgi:hypothetical protein